MQPAFLGPSGGRAVFVDLRDHGSSPRGAAAVGETDGQSIVQRSPIAFLNRIAPEGLFAIAGPCIGRRRVRGCTHFRGGDMLGPMIDAAPSALGCDR